MNAKRTNRRPESYNCLTGRFEYAADPAPSTRLPASDISALFDAFESETSPADATLAETFTA